MRPDTRAVSTVVDVALALLLVTASIATMVVFLGNDDQPTETRNADELAQTLSATTISADYSLERLKDKSAFEEEPHFSYERTAHGPAISLMSDAATSSLTFDTPSGNGRLNPASEAYVSAIEGGVNDRITGASENAHVVAIWRPYNESDIEGRVDTGPEPPAGADISTTTLRVDSAFDSITDAEVERAYGSGVNDKRPVARLVAESMVDGLFPSTETQLAIERRGFSGALARYRYIRLGEILRTYDETSSFAYTEGAFYEVYNRDNADADQANEDLVDALTEVILAELEEKYPDASAGTLADAISTGDVIIVIQTW